MSHPPAVRPLNPESSILNPTLVFSPHPLLALSGRELYYSTFLPGESIACYIERVGLQLGSREVYLFLNDELIERTEWALTVPRQGDLIAIRTRVRGGGGGGGSNPLTTILAIAVMIFAPYAAVALGGALGIATGTVGALTFAGSVLSAVISVAGNLLINALLPPPKPNLSQANGRLDNPSPTYSLAGGNNRARPYEPLPIVLGRHRIVPDLGARPYTEFVGDDQYLYQVFNFGLGDVLLSDFKIGDTPIENFSDVTIEQAGADGKLALFPGNVDTLAGGSLTAAAGWITRTSSVNARTLAVEITGQLFYANASGIVSRAVTLEVEYRAVGAPTWLPFVTSGVTLYHTHYWSAGRWEDDDGTPVWVQVDYGTVAPGDHVEGATYSVVVVSEEYSITNVWRLRPYSEINFGVNGSTLTEPAPVQGYAATTTQVEIASASRKPLRRTIGLDVADGQYEVRARRVTPDETDPAAASEIVWSQLRTYQPDTADYTGQRRVAVKIKASGQLQGTIDQFNAIATARCATWDGAAWNTLATRNPAWWMLWLLKGGFQPNGRRAYGCGLADTRIDYDSIKAFGAWCDAKSLTFDAVFDRAMNCADMLNAIARCGRGSLTLASGKFGAMWDAPGQPVMQAFGLGNIKLNTFRVRWVTEKLGDEVVGTFINPDLNWQQDTIRAPVPGVVAPVNPVNIELFGCTSKEMAGREVNLIAAAQKYRRRFVTFESDMEGLVVNRGDVVLLSHYLFEMQGASGWGYSGRLRAGTTTVLTLDKSVPFTPSTEHYAAIRKPDGTVHYSAVNYVAGESATITLATALPLAPNSDPDNPPLDYLWFFGLNSEGAAKKFKVESVDPLSQYHARVTCVDETPLYYAAETNDYTYVAPTPLTAQLPVVSNLAVSEELVRVGNGLAVELSVSWDVEGVYDHANIRASIDGTVLDDKVSYGRRVGYTVPPQGTMTITVTAVHPLYGVGASGVASITHTLTALDAKPSDVPWFVIDGDRLSWGAVDDADLAGYRLKFHYGVNTSFGDANPLHEGLATASPFTMLPRPTGQVTLMVKAVDTLGNESANPAYIVTDLGDALVANVVETINLRTLGWPGEIVQGAIDGSSDIAATDASLLMWAANDGKGMWQYDSDLMWNTQTWKEMYYLAQITPTQAGVGSLMTLTHEVEGDSYAIEYRRNGPGPMWTQDSESMWSLDDTTLQWTLPPGEYPRNMWSGDANLMWKTDANALMWAVLQGGFQSWPGSIEVFNEPFDLRVSTGYGPTRGKVKQLVFTVDMPDIVERFNDVVIAAGGTRLTLTKTYRTIKNVSVTVQSDGNGGIGERVIDKSATLGPQIRVYDAAGTAVTGLIDATVQGY